MSQSANSSSSTAVSISQRTVGVSFDLPPLKFDDLQRVTIDPQSVFDHIDEILPKLALPASKASFDWLSGDRGISGSANWFPQLENTPQYLSCRRALNDLQVTLDQGPLGSCLDRQRNRLVLVGAAACIGNMRCFIVPNRTLDPSGKPYDFGIPMLKGPELRPQPTSAPRPLNLNPPFGAISISPDYLNRVKPSARSSFPGLKDGFQLKVSNDFLVSAQLSGNPVKGMGSIAANLKWTPSAGRLQSVQILAELQLSSARNHMLTGKTIDVSVGLPNIRLGLINLIDPNIDLQLSPDFMPTIMFRGKFDNQ